MHKSGPVCISLTVTSWMQTTGACDDQVRRLLRDEEAACTAESGRRCVYKAPPQQSLRPDIWASWEANHTGRGRCMSGQWMILT